MLEELKKKVFEANLELVRQKLVIYTWGNVSGIDRSQNLVVIKPSGVSYDDMKAEDMVIVDFDGNVVEGKLRPSSDTATHIELYKAFSGLGGVVHTHSTYAVAWAQAQKAIPAFGTTHADHFYGAVPCTRPLTKAEVENNYELNTGKVIVETFAKIEPLSVPSVVVAGHGPFSWGETPEKAVYNAVVLEEVAKMAMITTRLGGEKPIDQYLLDKHYNRKHGKNAYYGQKK
ncbi:MAG TPA: L-ribulose-5-phosphate 4-epimerase [Bacteroidales bacterium]|nr:L-ribulose-5-phosphate 4-epimerase [Bacteroidales bacterium]